MGAYLKSIGFKADNINFVPISGLEGINLIGRAAHIADLVSWYQGKCLIEYLDAFRLPQRGVNKPLRVSIFDYYKSDMGNVIGDCVQAKVESGIIK